jgi:reverse gyrase
LVDYVRLLAEEMVSRFVGHDVPRIIYRWSCPNCGLSSSSHRLVLGLPCERCIKDEELRELMGMQAIGDHAKIYRFLHERGRVRENVDQDLGYREIVRVEEELSEFSEMFRRSVGRDPWSIQKMWARRVIMGSSFALMAPTGVGKTTFGVVMAIYMALKKGWRSLIVVPTIPLVNQVLRRAQEYIDRLSLGGVVSVVAYHSRLSQNDRRSIIDRLSRGDFSIFVTTSAFFRNQDHVNIVSGKINFFFIDDVDAILKGGKILYSLLEVMRIDRETIEKAEEIVNLKARLVFRESSEDIERINALKRDIRRATRSDIVIVISTATGRARGRRIKILREIFGFEVGTRHDVIRNVIDTYRIVSSREKMISEAVEIIKKIGGGGIIYVPRDLGIDYAEKIAEALSKSTGLRVAPLTSRSVKIIDMLASREIDVVVGVSTYYGVAVRGIDLPEVIRYAIFLEAPRRRVTLDMSEIGLSDIPRILELALDVVEEEKKDEVLAVLNKILRVIRRSSPTYLKEAFERVRRGEISSWAEKAIKEGLNMVGSLLSTPGFIDKLERNPFIKVERAGMKIYVYIPDWATYIQASGRTSRLYVGGISRGLSVILETDERLLKGLERRLRLISEDIALRHLDTIDLDQTMREIDRDRENIRRAREGRVFEIVGVPLKELTKTVLVVVESPNKARTIASFFGRPSVKEIGEIRVYEASLGNITLLITASGGHAYDLAVDDIDNNIYIGRDSLHGVIIDNGSYIPIYTTIKRCMKCGYQFTNDSIGELLRCPICGSQEIRDSRGTLRALRRVAIEVDEIYIATDPDTEGEKIAFDIFVSLLPYNNRIKRIEFHEVTRRAFIEALSRPRDMDINRVKAQLVRRIEDRWIGFLLSQKVTDHVKEEKDIDLRYRLSAGRVQTPVLGWVVTSTREHRKKKYMVIRLTSDNNEPLYQLEIPIADPGLKRVPEPGSRIVVRAVVGDAGEERLNPLPPYTTDAFLVDVSQYMRIPAPKAMAIAQDLFEMGLITYHRTDSTRISDVGLEIAKRYLTEAGKAELIFLRRWGEEGAHEGIRPTRPMDLRMLERMIAEGVIDIRLSRDHMRVYDMIFRRFIASQSRPARVRMCEVVFELSDDKGVIYISKPYREICGVIDPGFMEFYNHPFKVISRDSLNRSWDIEVTGELFRGDRLYTPGDLVRRMKQEGIGRPSTYAKIVDIILRRYVYKGFFKRTGYLVSNKYGRMVYDFLSKEYEGLINIERTRKLEEKMDLVEKGSIDYREVISDLYQELKGYNLNMSGGGKREGG